MPSSKNFGSFSDNPNYMSSMYFENNYWDDSPFQTSSINTNLLSFSVPANQFSFNVVVNNGIASITVNGANNILIN